jgi:hypothetical protein
MKAPEQAVAVEAAREHRDAPPAEAAPLPIGPVFGVEPRREVAVVEGDILGIGRRGEEAWKAAWSGGAAPPRA